MYKLSVNQNYPVFWKQSHKQVLTSLVETEMTKLECVLKKIKSVSLMLSNKYLVLHFTQRNQILNKTQCVVKLKSSTVFIMNQKMFIFYVKTHLVIFILFMQVSKGDYRLMEDFSDKMVKSKKE